MDSACFHAGAYTHHNALAETLHCRYIDNASLNLIIPGKDVRERKLTVNRVSLKCQSLR